MLELKKYFTTRELAKYTGISMATLISYRVNKIGPDYKKMGRMIRYNIDDVEAWIEAENNKSNSNKKIVDFKKSGGIL